MAVLRLRPSYGSVSYDPATPSLNYDRPQKLFRPRRLAPGRIQIQPIPVKDIDCSQDSRLVNHPARGLRPRLTTSRDSAKRLLRSVIARSSRVDLPLQPVQNLRPKSSLGEAVRDLEGAAQVGEESTLRMRRINRGSVSGPLAAHSADPRFPSVVRQSSPVSSQTTPNGHRSSPRSQSTTGNVDNLISSFKLDEERPVATGNGVSVGIHLAEPVLFLQGFDNNDNRPGNTAMLRGSLHIRVHKSAKIKAVTLKFKGIASTKWPEGIPPRKIEFEENDTIMAHTWPFFNAQFESAEKGTNADHVQLFKGTEGASSTVTRLDALGRSSLNVSQTNLSAKDARKLSLQHNHPRSFDKTQPSGGPGIAAKGFRTFLPGDYIYNFELPLDSRLPETIDVDLGFVKYELEATVERSGAFKSNLVGNKEITLIRAPSEGSLEQVEPIAISRNWEDQLHYDIVISGKSFPLGTQVPIAFKLTPLAKVQCHRIKVLVTENIEYFCSNKRVHRMEPTRKVQLFEKRADSAPVSTYPGSTMRITAGGGIPYDMRVAAARGEDVTPADATNLLGNLEGDASIGPTEMEFSVQLPSCHAMREKDRSQRVHFDTTYQNIQVHHWIKIVLRLSKPDLIEPGKRRHFEISIDSPFHILSCQATQANTSLPAYTSPQGAVGGLVNECGCPGAPARRNSPPSFLPTLNSINANRTNSVAGEPDRPPTSPGLARPPTAHLGGPQAMQRPVHLLRAPSFNPPAFSEQDPPPPMITPPPIYEDIASPTSGLADYFARLSDAYDDEDDDSSHRLGRVNVPLTPGGRVNRSMDVPREFIQAMR